jgi:hypothetical protein
MANVRAGTAYVDVKLGSVEKFKQELKEKVESAGSESGEKIGKNISEEMTKTVTVKEKTRIKKSFEEVGDRSGRDSANKFGYSFGDAIVKAKNVLQANVLAWLVPTFVAAGPFIGASLGAAIVAALPLGGIAGGIALIAKDPRISTTAKLFWEKFKIEGAKQAGVLIQPVLNAFSDLNQRLPEIMKPLQGIFLGTANFIKPLGTAITNMLVSILTGINAAVQNAGPIMDVFMKGLERLGVVIGDMFQKITADPEAVEGMADALDDLFGVLVFVIKWFTAFVISASRAYAQFKDAWGAIKSWFTGTIVPSLKRAGDQLVAVFNAIGNFFKAWWERLKGGFNGMSQTMKTSFNTAISLSRNFLNTVTSTISQLPGKIVGALRGLPGMMMQAAQNAISGFLNGFNGGAIIQKARDIANTVINTIKGALKIGSPSKVMEEMGMWTMKGFEQGMEKNAPSISSFLPSGVAQVSPNYGDIRNPQMDATRGIGGITVNNTVYGDVDPWRQAENMYFMLTARGGIA